MFQMIGEATTQPEDRKMMIVKVCAFVIAMAILGGTVYFFAFAPYASR